MEAVMRGQRTQVVWEHPENIEPVDERKRLVIQAVVFEDGD